MIDVTSFSEAAARRSRTYWLLARCFSESPSRTGLGELAAALGAVDEGAPLAEETATFGIAMQASLGAEADLQALAVEYTRLFGGISTSYGAPPPFESVARAGHWGGDAVLAVRAAYDEAEIEPPLQEAEAWDHLAVELRFMAIASFRECEAWRADDVPQAAALLRHQRDFLEQHVLGWMPDYCRTTATLAQTPLYRALLALAPRACELDRDDLDEVLATLPAPCTEGKRES